MQIRVFTVDEDGFTKIRPENLELMLNDAYEEGYNKNLLIIGFQEPKEPPKDAVYPTWYDYLHSIGVLYKKHTAGGDVTEIQWGNMMAHIPADIAVRLGLKPKENA